MTDSETEGENFEGPEAGEETAVGALNRLAFFGMAI